MGETRSVTAVAFLTSLRTRVRKRRSRDVTWRSWRTAAVVNSRASSHCTTLAPVKWRRQSILPDLFPMNRDYDVSLSSCRFRGPAHSRMLPDGGGSLRLIARVHLLIEVRPQSLLLLLSVL